MTLPGSDDNAPDLRAALRAIWPHVRDVEHWRSADEFADIALAHWPAATPSSEPSVEPGLDVAWKAGIDPCPACKAIHTFHKGRR